MNHVFIAIPENAPDSVIFGTRAPDPDKFKFINITCQEDFIKFEDYDAVLPDFKWSADISGKDIGTGLVEKFIQELETEGRYLVCPRLSSGIKSDPLTTAMWLLRLSGFYFPSYTKFGKLDESQTFHAVESLLTIQSWYRMTERLNSRVTGELVRDSLKEESRAWRPTFKVEFQDGTEPEKMFTKKHAIIGGSALAAAGLGVTAVVYHRELQEFFKQGPKLVDDVEDNASLLISKLGLAIDLCQADMFDSKNVKFAIKDAIEQAGKLSQLNEDMQHKLNKIAR